MYLLDTNILIHAMRYPSSSARRELINHTDDDLCISAVTYAELMHGTLKSANPVRARENTLKILRGIDILPFDMAEAMEFAEIKQSLQLRGEIIEDMDIMIAAQAKAGDHTLVTDNLKHMARVDGVEIENWIERNSSEV